MKNSKTALRELTAMYRSVLLKCLTLAVGALIATSANAATTLTEVIDSAKVAEAAQPQYDDYTYTSDIDGTQSAIDGTTTTVDNAKFDFAKVGDAEGTRSGNAGDLDYDKTAYGWTDHDGVTTRTADETIDPTTYSYTSTAADGSTSTVQLAATNPADLDNSGYTVTLSDNSVWTAGDAKIVASSYSYLDSAGQTHILVTDEQGRPIPDPDLAGDTVAASNMQTAYNTFIGDVEKTENEALRYEINNSAYKTELANLTADQTALATALENWTADNAALDTAQAARDAAQTTLDTANGNYQTAENNFNAYDASLGKVIDDRATVQANEAVAGEATIRAEADTALNAKVDGFIQQATDTFAQKQQWVDATLGITSANGNAVNAEYQGTTHLGAATTLTDADKALDAALTQETADRIAADAQHTADIATNRQNIATNTANIETNRQNIATNAANIETNRQNIATNTAAIATLNGDVNTQGSVLHTVKNTAENATYTGTTVTTATRAPAPQTLGSALSATTTQVNTNTQNIATNTGAIATNRQNIAANTSAIQQNTANIGSLRAEFDDVKHAYDGKFVSMDNKIEDLEDDMKTGLASNAALASLVPMSSEYKTQLSMGMGGYQDKQGLAIGAFHYAADNILLNAGAAWAGTDSYSYKAGATFGF